MDQMNQTPTQQNLGSSRKVLIWVGIDIVIAVIIVYFLLGQKSQAPTESAASQIDQQDTTAAAQKQLDSIDIGSLDADLKNIDDQLNSL